MPKEESKRVMTFANHDDYISFRHHTYKKSGTSKEVELNEVRYFMSRSGSILHKRQHHATSPDHTEETNYWIFRVAIVVDIGFRYNAPTQFRYIHIYIHQT